MIKYKVLTLDDSLIWNQYLSIIPDNQYDVYFTPEYYSLYENYGDGKALCFVFEKDKDIAIYPFLINSINKLGYDLKEEYYDIQGAYGYNGVISSNYSKDFIQSFFDSFDSFCENNNIVAEFVRFHPLLKNKNFTIKDYNIIFDRKTVYIDTLKPKEDIFSSFQRSTRKQIKRCTNKYKIEVIKTENDLSYLDDFLAIYKETMNRVKSVDYLYFNKGYFKSLLINTNSILYIAMYEQKPIAAITALFGKEYMHGHLGGALTEYLGLSAYSLLYWEMVKTAKERNKRFLHVGGGATSLSDDRLLEFKKNFSSDEAKFWIGKRVFNKPIYDDIVSQWKKNYIGSYQLNKQKILGYREISNYGK